MLIEDCIGSGFVCEISMALADTESINCLDSDFKEYILNLILSMISVKLFKNLISKVEGLPHL